MVNDRLSCLVRSSPKAMGKQAGGNVVYLIEELGDARMRCAQLKKYVKEALDLIEKSEKRDHFFEVAAHLIHGIPDTLFKLDKALDAAAMAGARLDYEEIKQTLKPEKADELEDVLEDVRLRYLKRRSEENSMTPKQAAEQLLAIADQTEATGQVPLAEAMTLLASLEKDQTKVATDAKVLASGFRTLAEQLTKKASRSELTAKLRTLIADQLQPTLAQMAATIYQTATNRQEVMDGFAKANPQMSQEELEKAADMWEQHKDSLKKAAELPVAAAPVSEPALDRYIGGIERAAKDLRHHLAKSEDKRPYDDMGVLFNQIRSTATTAMRQLGLKMAGETVVAYPENLSVSDNTVGTEEHLSKFEEGKPADPTKDMSEEDKKLWWKKHEENKDNFKAAAWKKDPVVAATTVAEVEAQISRFQEGKPADPTKEMSPEDAAKWKKENEENKDNFKAAAETTKSEWEKALREDEASLKKIQDNIKSLEDTKGNAMDEHARKLEIKLLTQLTDAIEQVIKNKKALISKLSSMKSASRWKK